VAETTLLTVLVILAGMTLVSIAGISLLVHRALSGTPSSWLSNAFDGHSDNRRLSVSPKETLVDTVPAEDNVLTRLTFEESFDIDLFARASSESALNQLNAVLADQLGDGITMTVNGVRLVQSGTEMTFNLSRQGQDTLKAGTAVFARHGTSGRTLPFIQEVTTGKAVEMLKGASGAKALARLASLSSMVVGAAHIISGADIASRLKRIDSKVSLLLDYRRTDQVAELERIYTSARELCLGPINSIKQLELWRLRGELRQIRFGWRRELEVLLSQVEGSGKPQWLLDMELPQFSGQFLAWHSL